MRRAQTCGRDSVFWALCINLLTYLLTYLLLSGEAQKAYTQSVKGEKSSNLRQREWVTVEVFPVRMEFNATGVHALQAVPLHTDTH